MYEVSIDAEFCAAHAISISGEREQVHGHNWRVTVTVASRHLDSDGLLVDFHDLQDLVTEVLTPLSNADLNATPPFDRTNPTAEHVARHIAERVGHGLMQFNLGSPLREHDPDATVYLASVRVTEAPGCSVVYRP